MLQFNNVVFFRRKTIKNKEIILHHDQYKIKYTNTDKIPKQVLKAKIKNVLNIFGENKHLNPLCIRACMS